MPRGCGAGSGKSGICANHRLEGIEPGSFRFSGAFNADDPQSLATLLVREPDLIVENQGEEIVIRKRE